MDLAAENTILQYLKQGFEQDLFKAAVANVDDANNKLRLNNFAYAMRELIRTVLERLAPDDEVVNAPWFEPNDKDKPDKVTRTQRIKYAIQGWLSDEFVIETLGIEHSENDKRLRKSIDTLSKYTHVTPLTFGLPPVEVTKCVLDVLLQMQCFLMDVAEAHAQIRNAAMECIDAEMIEEFYMSTQNDLDIIATHYEVLSYVVTRINTKSQDDDKIILDVSGIVNVRHQYGSNGDMKRGDGFEMEARYPFSSKLIASYKNREGDVHIVDKTIDIDTSSFYE